MRQLNHLPASIQFAICDIHDAGLEPPDECESIAEDTSNIQHCLQAIERSSQMWTSYTSHRQNIIAQCFAYKRLHDEDESRRIYNVIAQEKRALLRILSEYFEAEAARHENFQRDLRYILKRRMYETELAQKNVDSHSQLNSDLEKVLSRFEAFGREQENLLQNALGHVVGRILPTIEDQFGSAIVRLEEDIADQLSLILKNHLQSSLSREKDFKTSLLHSESALNKSIRALTDTFLPMADVIQSHLKENDEMKVSLYAIATTLESTKAELNEVAKSQSELMLQANEQKSSLYDVLWETMKLVNTTIALQRHKGEQPRGPNFFGRILDLRQSYDYMGLEGKERQCMTQLLRNTIGLNVFHMLLSLLESFMSGSWYFTIFGFRFILMTLRHGIVSGRNWKIRYK